MSVETLNKETSLSENGSPESSALVGEPVRYLEMDAPREPEEGIALCLSGGNRAMLFHAGVMTMNWHRLNFYDHIVDNFEGRLFYR